MLISINAVVIPKTRKKAKHVKKKANSLKIALVQVKRYLDYYPGVIGFLLLVKYEDGNIQSQQNQMKRIHILISSSWFQLCVIIPFILRGYK